MGNDLAELAGPGAKVDDPGAGSSGFAGGDVGTLDDVGRDVDSLGEADQHDDDRGADRTVVNHGWHPDRPRPP